MPNCDALSHPAFFPTLRRLSIPATRFLLTVSIDRQSMRLWQHMVPDHHGYVLLRPYRVSTSRFGIGQVENSNHTPLGLHRVARKIGGGWPPGTVFRARVPVGFTWQGMARATIVHRILWLEGLEPGFNRGGKVDSFKRYIYIHGVGDETTLGRPASHGCIHMAAADLIPLYDWLPQGTLVWIDRS